jgi:hypothetical protein
MSDEVVTTGVREAARDGLRAGGFQPRPVRYGLPCANCKAYYPAALTVCPVCQCSKRVPPVTALVRSIAML